MSDTTAHLKANSQDIEFPILKGTYGNPVIDITTLGKQGFYTIDPGFLATASCESKITFIDGGKGILLYRGYPIEQLAEDACFLEICYLLLHGELPNTQQYEKFTNTICQHMPIPKEIHCVLNAFKKDAHPMAMLMSLISALAGYYHGKMDINNPDDRLEAAYHLIAKIPTLAAMCYKHSCGEEIVLPQPELGYAENFMHMLQSTPHRNNNIKPVLAKAFDRIFTLHADHEQNASTSTVRLAGSTGTDPFASIVAGVAALWGPAHGGANEAALNMMREIGDESHINEYVDKAKDKNDPFRLMGFGHRVYKNYDPRAKVMRATCHEVLDEQGCHDDPLFKIALKLEKIALEDQYFIDKKLYPNVDFYSGITLNALGIPPNMFTVLFALARTVGWIAHWHEMLGSKDFRIGRPRQLYTGSAKRDFVKMADRK